METLSVASIDVSVAGRVRDGEQVSGDQYLVRPTKDGILLAVIDGLGHGPPASESAALAVGMLEHDAEAPVADLLRRCHGALVSSRGVTIGLCSIRSRDGRLAWVGVGSVAGLILREGEGRSKRHEALLSLPGIVGAIIPRDLAASEATLAPGDALVIATDGIRAEFEDELGSFSSNEELASGILDRHARRADDSLVLVASYRDPGS